MYIFMLPATLQRRPSLFQRLIALLDASDLSVVVSVLNLLYVIAKRSNFLTRIPNNQRQQLIERLNILAESWGGKENGFSLADCCQESTALPSTASTLHFEFYEDSTDSEKVWVIFFHCFVIITKRPFFPEWKALGCCTEFRAFHSYWKCRQGMINVLRTF